MTRSLKSPAERFWSQVDKNGPGECWIWTGYRTKWGYGRFSLNNRTVVSHRFAYEQLVGPIPPGLALDHVKARGCTSTGCVNPAHLEPVTLRENTLRQFGSRETCRKGHPVDWVLTANGRRRCRPCRTEDSNKARVERHRRQRARERGVPAPDSPTLVVDT